MGNITRSGDGGISAGGRRAGAPLRVIVLAGRDAREADPLARAFGMSHRCLVPLAGRPLVAHVLQVAALHPTVESLAVSVEREAFDGLFDVLSKLPGRGIVKLVEARANLVDSVMAAAEGWDGPILITTADHALLTPASIDALLDALETDAREPADVAFAMATRASALAVNPDRALLFHEFSDEAYASCNLYAAATPDALIAAEVFRGGGRFAGNAWRVLRAFGLVNLLLLRLRAFSLAEAMERVSARFSLRIVPVVLADGSQAIDVDDERSHAVVEALIHEREGIASSPASHRSRIARGL